MSKIRIVSERSVKLEIIHDPLNDKTGNLKIDCEDKKAIFIINKAGKHADVIEETIVPELLHLKLYPLDQTTETLIEVNDEKGTNGYNFVYSTFMTPLKQTVQELTKCFLLEFGENKELSFGGC